MQAELDFNHLSRSNDPVTSKLAAKEHVESGRNQSQKDQIANILKQYVGCTIRELEKLTGIDHYTLARRLPELAKEKPPRAERGEPRECTVVNRLMTTWHPA